MNEEEIIRSVACCGLLCNLCQSPEVCSCRTNNHCGKRLAPGGCFQHDCCAEKGIEGCWQCADAPCGKDMLAEGKVKMRAFITCIRQDGSEQCARYIVRNQKAGVVYHRDGIFGDYDLQTEDEVLKLLREGKG